MKRIVLATLFLIQTIAFSQDQDQRFSVDYKTISLYDIESVDEEVKVDPFKMKYLKQMKKNFESIEYVLHIVEDKSLFETIKKMDVSGLPVNPFQKLQNSQKFYVDSSEYIEQLETFGRLLLITEPSNDFIWSLEKDTKDILGYKCYKANLVKTENEKVMIEAWYAPEIPYQFGPKGFHGLPGLILEIKRNNNLVFIAHKINWENKSFVIKPTQGKKVSRSDFDSMVNQAVDNMKSLNEN